MALDVFCCRSGLRVAYTIVHYLHVLVNPGREQVSAGYWGGVVVAGGYTYKLVMAAAASRRAQETKVTPDLTTFTRPDPYPRSDLWSMSTSISNPI